MSDEVKEVVQRFNREVIEQLNRTAFEALMLPSFVNHAAPPGAPTGAEGMWTTFHDVLHPALSGLKVTILDQIAEGEKVTTRKVISGTHTGTLLGVAPTGRPVTIDVIDIVRVENGRYAEHWGLNTLAVVLARLRGA